MCGACAKENLAAGFTYQWTYAPKGLTQLKSDCKCLVLLSGALTGRWMGNKLKINMSVLFLLQRSTVYNFTHLIGLLSQICTIIAPENNKPWANLLNIIQISNFTRCKSHLHKTTTCTCSKIEKLFFFFTLTHLVINRK